MLVYQSEDSTKRYQKTMLGVRAENISGESTCMNLAIILTAPADMACWETPHLNGNLPHHHPKKSHEDPRYNIPKSSHDSIPSENPMKPWHLHILHGDLSPDLVMRGDLEADGLHVGSMGPLAQWSMVTESPLVAGWNGGVKSPSFTHLTHLNARESR